jgi:hypothetical protein
MTDGRDVEQEVVPADGVGPDGVAPDGPDGAGVGSSGSFYGWLWRVLPGPMAVRILLCALLVVAVVVLLFGFVFPWLEPRLPFGNETVTGGGG